MIKFIYFMIFLLFLTSCDNDKVSSIEKIVDNGNYSFQIGYAGCFGEGTEKVDVKKRGESYQATYTYLDYSKPDGPHEKTKLIPWGREKDRQIKEIFLTGINLKDTLLHCTLLTSYRLNNFPNDVSFEDPSCTMTEKIESLLR
ncbi:MAG TPA: hypothetical protein PLJ08_03785 [Cyclobacteriaceae bacterium]|nr:hypothetical protein [Cyclobacteriaceae bacterium]